MALGALGTVAGVSKRNLFDPTYERLTHQKPEDFRPIRNAIQNRTEREQEY